MTLAHTALSARLTHEVWARDLRGSDLALAALLWLEISSLPPFFHQKPREASSLGRHGEGGWTRLRHSFLGLVVQSEVLSITPHQNHPGELGPIPVVASERVAGGEGVNQSRGPMYFPQIPTTLAGSPNQQPWDLIPRNARARKVGSGKDLHKPAKL